MSDPTSAISVCAAVAAAIGAIASAVVAYRVYNREACTGLNDECFKDRRTAPRTGPDANPD